MAVSSTAVDQFLQTWIEEFTRAVEMFSGEVPSLRCSRAKTLGVDETTDLLWWKQDFEGNGTFTTWIGVKKETLLALGGVEDPGEARSTYFEMIGQAQSGAAHVLSTGLDTALKCETGEDSTPPDFASLRYGIIGITLGGKELPAMIFAIEPAIEQLLAEDSVQSSQAIQTAPATPAISPVHQPMLNRLMELELPLSIALGRATMPIKEVLKVTSGSVIELDRSLGDYVELLVHGTVVARGEVVSVKGNYGVRIKEIISQQDRMHLYRR